jgi:hypothetical protein
VIVAALTVTDAVPVEDRVTVCVVGVLALTLPNDKLVVLTLSVDVEAFNCRANVFEALPELAVSVTACAVPTEVTVAVKPALAAPAAMLTVAGTVTALLLLARFTANPPAAAAAFNVTVQLSVPAPVTEPLVQLSPLSTGTPVPLRLTTVDELLVRESVPAAAPAAVGSN